MSLSEEHNLDDLDDVEDFGDPTLSTKKGKKKREAQALRKAPQAPKRFKSSYICFFMAKQSEIKTELGDDANVTSVSKRSAEMWKNLPPEERAHWDEVAAKDKQRFMNEKASYTGPWQVPWKRVKKDPSAPRRPMSAFLFYSIGKRQQIKKENPDMKNTEISRQLGEMWRSLSEEEKKPFVETEKKERDKYKVAMAKWRQESQAKQEELRKVALQQQTMVTAMQEQQMYADPNQMPPTMFYGTYPPFMYPAATPFQLPTNGKQPVILGANGMPVSMPVAKTQQPAYQPFDAAQAQAFNEFAESGGEAAP